MYTQHFILIRPCILLYIRKKTVPSPAKEKEAINEFSIKVEKIQLYNLKNNTGTNI